MMDYFAVLEQPRRPWLDQDRLKQKYQELTLSQHPDRRNVTEPGKSEADSVPCTFAAINEGYRILRDHKLRLQHLLTLEGRGENTGAVPPEELTELFMKTGGLLQEIDRLIEKLRSTTSALSRSLLRSEVLNAQQRSEALLHQLQDLEKNLVTALREADMEWDAQRQNAIDHLADLHNRFAYLGRWIDQLRQRQFDLNL